MKRKNSEKREATGINVDGSSGTIVERNKISGFNTGISGVDSEGIKIIDNVINSEKFSDDDLIFIKEELDAVQEAIKELEDNKNRKSHKDIFNKLGPTGVKLFLYLLKVRGLIDQDT